MKKTIKKRAFISAIAMLIVSAIVLTSSTFAWFSMAKRVEVETMQLNITSPEGIQISANTSAFTTKLTMDDFTGASATRFMADTDNTNHFPEVLSPSSSAFRVSGGTLPKFFSGSIDDTGKAKAVAVTDATGGYVVFDLFVKLGSNTDVYFKDTTITCSDNEDVPSAMRLAVVNCGNSQDKNVVKTMLSGVRRYGEQRSIVVFEPNANKHSAASGAEDGVYEATEGVLAAYSNVNPQGTNKNIFNHTTYTGLLPCTIAPDNVPNPTGEGTYAPEAYFIGKEGINRIRVYIWMEGNDIDCANDVAGATIDVNLVLTIA